MALPTEAGAIHRPVSRHINTRERVPASRVIMPHFRHPIVGVIAAPTLPVDGGKPSVSQLINGALSRGRFFSDARGLYRVFNDAEYRFYRSNIGPPVESDAPFATSATIPHEPADLFADGSWFLSVSFFNGVIDSGFLRIGSNGESYLRMDIAGGVEEAGPPQPVNDAALQAGPGGTARIQAFYAEIGPLRAEQFAMKWTVDGSDPPILTPLINPSQVVAIPPSGLAFLDFSQGGLMQGTVLKIRIHTRRITGGAVYSESSPILTIIGDTQGPAAPVSAQSWPGRLPDSF